MPEVVNTYSRIIHELLTDDFQDIHEAIHNHSQGEAA